jgi:hypothetical protein
MMLFGQVQVQAGPEWNPAGRYLVCGFVLAWCGCLVSLVCTIGLAIWLVGVSSG